MSDAERARATLRAAAEVVVPGLVDDPTPGAGDVEAERFVAHYLAYLIPGLDEGVVTLLDGIASERFGGRAFVACSLEERREALEALEAHEVEALRDLPSLIGALAVAAVYGEWTGLDADGRLARRPIGWDLTGFDGPSRGRGRLLRG